MPLCVRSEGPPLVPDPTMSPDDKFHHVICKATTGHLGLGLLAMLVVGTSAA